LELKIFEHRSVASTVQRGRTLDTPLSKWTRNEKIWNLKIRGSNAFFSSILLYRHIHTFFFPSLFNCFESSKRYCKPPLDAPIAMKIIIKTQGMKNI